jgi:hypothetical protein
MHVRGELPRCATMRVSCDLERMPALLVAVDCGVRPQSGEGPLECAGVDGSTRHSSTEGIPDTKGRTVDRGHL